MVNERAAIVTGAASGIGKAIAEILVQHGASVVINDVDGARAERAGAHMPTPERCLVIAGDISDPQVAERLVGRCVERFGRLDIVVNNAGISPAGLVKTQSFEEWQRAFEVNLQGPLFLSQAALTALSHSDQARIINITSEIAFHGMMYQGAYASSKSALNAVTKSLARIAGRRGINVNAICPGVVPETGLVKEFTNDRPEYESILRFYRDMCPLGRSGTPTDIANVVLMLASKQASFVNGQLLVVNGGTS